jgi:hypothetical protein
MRYMRLMGVAFVAAAWMGFQPSTAKADDTTAWSTNAASCVPLSTSGLFITAGAVTAGAGTTVTLYCGITRSALSVGFNQIEIIYKGSGVPPVVNSTAENSTSDVNTMAAVILDRGVVTSELIEMSKTTGKEDVKCGVQSKGSSAAIALDKATCRNSMVDFNSNFYYLRIIVKSGLTTLQQETIYGSSLTAR